MCQYEDSAMERIETETDGDRNGPLDGLIELVGDNIKAFASTVSGCDACDRREASKPDGFLVCKNARYVPRKVPTSR